MKKVYIKIMSLCMLVASLNAMQQPIDTNNNNSIIDQQVESFIPTPKSLPHAKKLTQNLKDYLAHLQEAATLLVLQHQRMEFTENIVNARTRTFESRKKLENFQFSSINTSSFEDYFSDNTINTPGFIINSQTPEARVVYLRYQNLFTGIDIGTQHLPIILELLHTENLEVQELGRYLLSKLETTFYEKEQIVLDKATQDHYELPLVQYLRNHTIPSYLEKYLSYLKYTNTIQHEWHDAYAQDRELHQFKAMLSTYKTQGVNILVKPVYQDQREYDHKATTKRLRLLDIYNLKLDELRSLYRALYQKLKHACTVLKNRGVAGQTLIQYKKNGATGKALSEDLTTLDLPKPRNFDDIIQNYQESQKPYSFIETQLDVLIVKSKAYRQNKKLAESQDIQKTELVGPNQHKPELLYPVDVATQTKKEYQTNRYYVNEKNPLYIKIHDRQEQCTFVLYRIAHPEDTLINKPYVNFTYTDRVTRWFTDPMDRLQEDGYTNPDHHYYTSPERHPEKIFIHAFSPLIDDYLFALGIETPSPYKQADKNVRILGEIQRAGQATRYVYFTYNFCQDTTDNWLCNHRCIEVQAKSAFLETTLNQARWDVNFPPLK